MEEVKYIPGDLVHVKKAALHFQDEDLVFKVISSFGGALKVIIFNGNGTVYSITNNAVLPISITEELLSKNGWNEKEFVIEESVIDYYRYTNKDRFVKVRYYPETKTFDATLDGVILCKLSYLHDFQHLMFGLGLRSDLKV